MAELTLEQRQDVLAKQVAAYQRQGWVLQTQTDTTANLVMPAKKYGCVSRVLFGLFLLFAPRRDRRLFLSVHEDGKVERRFFTD